MRDLKKKYVEPVAEVTEFECEDVITVSGVDLMRSIGGVSDYKYVDSTDWNSVYGSN